MQKIIQYSVQKISGISLEYKRYLYDKITEVEEPIVGITGLRGVGKTTLLLQIAHKYRDISLYFSMDSVFAKGKKIFDIIEDGYREYGYRYFFIDEIHKYPDWEQDLKTVYDFLPDVRIVFSGSSSIDLIRGNYDLSRRGLLFSLHKFSFREYLYLKYQQDFPIIGIQTVLQDYKKLSLSVYSKERNISRIFREYLSYGELGFSYETPKEYYGDKLGNIINKIIYEDISSFYRLKTENIYYFFEVLKFIANSAPSSINYSNIAQLLSTTPDTVKTYVQILSEIGFLHIIGREGKISVNLRKSKKIFFELTNYIEFFSDAINTENTIGTKRESFVVSALQKIGTIYYPEKGDVLFLHEGQKFTFEIGGKNKKFSQVRDLDNAFLIKDDIDIGIDNQIPIWLFGFLY